MRVITLSKALRLARAAILAIAALSIPAASATADLRYVHSFGLIPNPPLSDRPTTFVLYGTYATDCGVVDETTVIDSAHVAVRVRSFIPCPTESVANHWAAPFDLGVLAAGNHTVSVTLTMDRPDSGITVHTGSFTFGVEDPSQPQPPPEPPPVPPLLSLLTTEPNPATSDAPVTLIVGGLAPFVCPVVTHAAILDTSRLALTISPSVGCPDTTSFWIHRFELGLQRAGHHLEDLAITIEGPDPVTHHLPVDFLVIDPIGWPPPPPDSLPLLSRSRPNPFSVESRFSVTLEDGTNAEVAVFDLFGRRVRTVFRGRFAAGTTELAWNGRREDGTRAEAGIYFYRLTLPGRVLSTRLVLLPQP